MDDTTQLSELSDKLDIIARIARTLAQSAAQRYALPCPPVRIVMDSDPLVIVAGPEPRIDISAGWLFGCVLTDSATLARTIERAVILADARAHQTLERTNPSSYVWIEERRKFRASQKDFSLPLRHFAEMLTITLTCPLTGASLSERCAPRDANEVRERIARKLTETLYDDATTAELLDTIAAARESQSHTRSHPTPSRITMVPYNDGLTQRLDYDDTPHEPEPLQFALASLYVMHSPFAPNAL